MSAALTECLVTLGQQYRALPHGQKTAFQFDVAVRPAGVELDAQGLAHQADHGPELRGRRLAQRHAAQAASGNALHLAAFSPVSFWPSLVTTTTWSP